MAAHHVTLEYVISLHVMVGMLTATVVMKMVVKQIRTLIRPIAESAKMPVRKIMAKQHVTSEPAGSPVILDMQTATSVLKPTAARQNTGLDVNNCGGCNNVCDLPNTQDYSCHIRDVRYRFVP